MRRWFGSLLLACAAASPLLADVRPDAAPAGDERPSHRPIRTGLENDLTPEQRLANRLQGSRLRKGNEDDDKALRNLAKRLLEDKDLVESLRKNLKPEDVDRLKKTLDANRGLAEGLGQDPALRKLVEQGMANKNLTDKDRELIQRWREKAQAPPRPPFHPGEGPVPPAPPMPPGHRPPVPPVPNGQAPPVPPPQPSPATTGPRQQTPEWLKRQLDRSARDITRYLDSPSGKSLLDSLRGIGRRAADARTKIDVSPVGERVRGMGRYLPKPGNWMLDRMRPRSVPRLGSLPRVGALPRLPAGAAPAVVGAVGVEAAEQREVVHVGAVSRSRAYSLSKSTTLPDRRQYS